MSKGFKKILSIVLAIILVSSCFSMGVSASTLRKLDLAFVIDTTGSMSDDIDEVKRNMRAYLGDLDESRMNYRVAVVDYRDFPERTGYSGDYPYCVQLNFTSNYESILEAINNLNLGNGGDVNETICSALIDGLSELSWRSDAGKAVILMGDAPALDPEPITGYTKDMAIKKLLYNDTAYEEDLHARTALFSGALSGVTSMQDTQRSRVTLFAIATSSYSVSGFDYLATGTGGTSYVAGDSADISDIIREIIDIIPDVVEEPTFWARFRAFLLKVWWFISFQWGKIWPIDNK